MADLYASPNPAGSYSDNSGIEMVTGNQEFDKYLSGLGTEEKQKALDAYNAPPTGEELNNMLQQKNAQGEVFEMAPDQYNTWKQFRKNQETHILSGMGEAAMSVLGDFQKAAGAVADHPLEAFAKATPSTIEAFAQGTRNLYGMLAQSSDPNSILFKMKQGLTADGSDPQAEYQQFLDAQKFNIHSGNLASGKETLIMDKDVIDHDMTQAMSYIADPTLFIPFGEVASAGMRAVGMGEKLAALSARTSMIKSAIIGGTLKWGVGAPIEFAGKVVRGTIDRTLETAGNIFEGATGISAKEANATLRASSIPVTAASFAGHSIPVASDISKIYVAGSTAAGVGEAFRTLGDQMMNQQLRRGNLSFAAQAIIDTKNAGIPLSAHAEGILRVLNAVDPVLSYGATIGEGMVHGAVIGGGLGYLSGEEEGMAHGMGAGMALGGIGAGLGKVYADVSGGTRFERAAVQGQFALDFYKENDPSLYQFWSKAIIDANGDTAKLNAIYQHIGSIDTIAGKYTADMHTTPEQYSAAIKAMGYDPETGAIIDPATGKPPIGADGKPIVRMASANEFQESGGFCVINKDGKVHVVINGAKDWSDVLPHELFHAVMRTTQMYDKFIQDWSSHLFGKFGTDGTKLEGAKIDPDEFRDFYKRYVNGIKDPAEKAAKMKMADVFHEEWKNANGDFSQMEKNNPQASAFLKQQSEEFAAYYYTQWIKGKPLDYLFHGGKLPAMRGAMENIKNRFLDFWANKVNKEAPSFDFNATDASGKRVGLDAAFQGGKEGGSRVRVPSLDRMLEDLLRMQSQTKAREGGVSIREMTPAGRLNWIKNNGVDGLIHAIDPVTGEFKGINKAQQDKWRKQNAVDVVNSLNRLHGKNENSYSGPFTEEQLTHLVNEGVWTQAFADRIKSFQEALADPTKQNVFYHQYHGKTQEISTNPNAARLTGDQVPVTDRATVPVKMDLAFGKDGTFKANLLSVDKKVLDARINEQWKNPEVQKLWGSNRDDMIQDYIKYVNNMSADESFRQLSAVLLEDGRGNGARMRDVFHQMTGVVKAKGRRYENAPIADIVRPQVSTAQNLSLDLMSPLTVDASHPRLNFTEDSLIDHSRNFHISDMDSEDAPNGKIYTHELGYKFNMFQGGKTKLFDKDGKFIGTYTDAESAGKAAEKHNAAYEAKRPADIVEGDKVQRSYAGKFNIIPDDARAEAKQTGDIAQTEWGKAFIGDSQWIPQTREEFMLGKLLELRQGDPKQVEQVFKAGYNKYNQLDQAVGELKKQKLAAFNANDKAKVDSITETIGKIDQIRSRLTTIHTMYEEAEALSVANSGIGSKILSDLNRIRQNSPAYYHLADGLFGDLHNSQFQTGKPFTTVATHGTISMDFIRDKEFKASELGTRHGSLDDKQGAFLAGSTRTSYNYSEIPTISGNNYVQTREMFRSDNPLVVDMKHDAYDSQIYNKFFKQAKEGNHDVVVIQNVKDGAPSDTVYVVMSDKLHNIARFDEHIGKDIISTEDDAGQLHIRGPVQESTPRGDVLTSHDVGLSWHQSGQEGEQGKRTTWQNMFYSPLKKVVNKILDETTGNSQSIKAARLLNLIKNASGGDVGRILTESEAIGLTDFLKEKGQQIIPIQDVKDFIEKNGITIKTNKDTTRVYADFGDTQEYISKPWNWPYGNKHLNYHTILVHINPEHAHGVAGHFNAESPTGTTGDTLVHARGTMRIDAEGKKVFHVEEIQPQNSRANALTEEQLNSNIKARDELKKVNREFFQNKPSEDYEQKASFPIVQQWTEGTSNEGASIPQSFKRNFDGKSVSLPDAMQDLRKTIGKYISSEKDVNKLSKNSAIDVIKKKFGFSDDVQFMSLEWHMLDYAKQYYADLYSLAKWEHDAKLALKDSHWMKKLEEENGGKPVLLNPDNKHLYESELGWASIPPNNKPLQDFAETTRLAHRAIMRKAVELGADRVTFVRAQDTHPDVQMRNARGERLYDKAIPEIVNGELKKHGTKLKPANNEDKISEYITSDTHDEQTMLSKSLGYNITSKMAEDVMEGQPFFHQSGQEGNWSKEVADAQRNKPEEAMVKAQYKMGGGAMPIIIEHAGDILHRTYERININNGSFGYNTVKYKVDLALKRLSDYLINKDEFRKEIVRSFAYDKNSIGTSEQHLIEVKKLLKEFGDAHAELPAYNELQRRVKTLNVALGNLDFGSAYRELKFLKIKLINEKTWTDFAKEGMTRSPDFHQSGKDETPAIGKFKVPDKVKKGISALQDAIYKQADEDKVPKNIKDGLTALQEAVRKQDATDEVPVKDIKKSYKALKSDIDLEQMKQGSNAEVMAGLKKLMESAQFADLADAPIPKAGGTPQARAAGWKALAGAVQEQTIGKTKAKPNVRKNAENKSVQSPQAEPATTDALTQQQADNMPQVAAQEQAQEASAQQQQPQSQTIEQTQPQVQPEAPAMPSGGGITPTQKAWRGWTVDNGKNGSLWSNMVGYTIMVQGDKFKVYNPYKAIIGIYNNLDQAKRRVQREEPRR